MSRHEARFVNRGARQESELIMSKPLFGGVNAAATTAFRADLSVDVDETARHCHWLASNGCNGLAVLGTTGEANSLGLSERMSLLEGLIGRGVSPALMLPGTGTPAIPDTVLLTRHAEMAGCRGALLLPPFYYKNPSDDGLFAYFSEVIQRVGGDIGIYLYNFPQQSAIPFSLGLVARLLKAFPGKIRGIKDSFGDFATTKAYIDNFSADGFEVYTGADAGFQEVLVAGGAGCITATSNLTCPLAATIYANPATAEASAAQAALAAIRKVVALAPTISAVKVLLAHRTGTPTWAIARPPHHKLSDDLTRRLVTEFDRCGASAAAA